MAEAYIVAAARTAGGKKGGALKDWHPADMAAEVLDALVERAGIDPAMDRPGSKGQGPLVILNPGAQYGDAKCWLPENFAAVADRLKDAHGSPVDFVPVGQFKPRDSGTTGFTSTPSDPLPCRASTM